MTFLHPEFFLWMVPPVGVLFYFWLTQKPGGEGWLDEAVLQKLRSPETTMGLKGRNALFLIASLLLITAMAQPVLEEDDPGREKGVEIIFAVQTGMAAADFERVKRLALEAMANAAGHTMGVIAFDERLYRVAPLSDDYPLLAYLVRNLPKTGNRGDLSLILSEVEEIPRERIVVVVAAEGEGITSERALLLNDSSDIASLLDQIRMRQEASRMQAHVPLFYYPLGAAMVLIWIALSSMSKRRSVPLVALVALLGIGEAPATAGVFDFGVLYQAQKAYERGEYAKSAALFERYQQSHDTPQVRYNRANALYRANRYEEAEYWYGRVYTDDPLLEKRRRHNLEQARKQRTLREIGGERSAEHRYGERDAKREERGAKSGAEKGFVTRLYRYP